MFFYSHNLISREHSSDMGFMKNVNVLQSTKLVLSLDCMTHKYNWNIRNQSGSMSEGREMLLQTNEELLPLWQEFTTGLLIIKIIQLNLPMILSSLPPHHPHTKYKEKNQRLNPNTLSDFIQKINTSQVKWQNTTMSQLLSWRSSQGIVSKWQLALLLTSACLRPQPHYNTETVILDSVLQT